MFGRTKRMQVKVNAKRLAKGHGRAADASSGGASMAASGELDADILRLREELQRFEAPLPPHSALLHPAEGNTEVAKKPAVDPDRAGVEGGRHTMRALEVARPHRGGEAVARGVGERDRLVIAVERGDRDDRPEDLVLQ